MASEARDSRPRARGGVLATLGLIAVVVLALDQATKLLVVTHLQLGERVDVIGDAVWFYYIRNSGAAFSLGSGSTWVFSLVGLAVLVFIVWFAQRIRSFAWASLFGLLLGGLLGNLGDRLFRAPGFGVGEVVDFIKIPLLPAFFNLADVAIVTSMALFLLLTLLGKRLDGGRHREPSETDHDAEQSHDGAS